MLPMTPCSMKRARWGIFPASSSGWMTFQSAASQPTSRTLRGEEEGDSKDGVGAGEANEGMTGAGSGNDGLEMKNLRSLSYARSVGERSIVGIWYILGMEHLQHEERDFSCGLGVGVQHHGS